MTKALETPGMYSGSQCGRPFRIVHIIVGLEVGGAEHMLRKLVQEQQRAARGFQISVISLTSVGPIGETLQRMGIEVVALGLTSPFGVPLVLRRLKQILVRKSPHLVQTWMVHADLIGGLAARLAGVRNVVWGIRTTDFSLTPRATQAVRWLCARLSRYVPDAIVCVAQASRRSHEAVGYDPQRMLVIPNGFDLSALQPAADLRAQMRLAFGFQPGQIVIGCVGRYNRAKDQANFVHAAAMVAQRNPSYRFLMVGRDVDSGNASLMDLIATSGCAEQFVLLGERPDVPACLAAMDVFALPSRSEGFPNVVGEAMAMGLPCAVTDVGDAAWLVGDTGLVVPKGDSAALAQAIQQLASLPIDERMALGTRARARVVSEFSMERAGERFAQLYESLISGANS